MKNSSGGEKKEEETWECLKKGKKTAPAPPLASLRKKNQVGKNDVVKKKWGSGKKKKRE